MSLEAISISTSKYIKTVNAKIDDHVFTVRKMGAGLQLDLSREMNNLVNMRTAILNIEGRQKVAKTDDDKEKLTEEMLAKMGDFEKVVKRIEDIFVSIFDDRGDGSKSRNLVHSLGIDNMQKIYSEIFDEAKEDDKDE